MIASEKEENEVNKIIANDLISIHEVGSVVDILHFNSWKEEEMSTLFEPFLDKKHLTERWKHYLKVYRNRRLPLTVKIWKIPNCIIVPPHMILMTQDGKVIKDSTRKLSVLGATPALKHLAQDVPGIAECPLYFDTDDRSIYALFCIQNWNYYHFMVEVLPRLYWINMGIGEYLPIIGRNTKNFHQEACSLFSKKPVEDLRKPTLFREVYYMETIAFSNVSISPLVRDFYQNYTNDTEINKTRLYISRSDAKIRHIENEDDIIPDLMDRGFEVIQPGSLPVEKQISLFRSADVVIGAHGAGLANLVFCKKATQVLEILPESHQTGLTSYAALSDLFSLKYTQYICHAQNADDGANSNMKVNKDFFIKFIDHMLRHDLND